MGAVDERQNGLTQKSVFRPAHLSTTGTRSQICGRKIVLRNGWLRLSAIRCSGDRTLITVAAVHEDPARPE
jgi:hypothetical protein